MIQSFPIQIEGRTVGIAVAHEAAAMHFVALDPRLGDLEGACFPDAAEMRRVAALVLARETGGGGVAPRMPRAA